MAIVYLVSNEVTGLHYVGCTTKSLRTRWTEHACEAKSKRTSSPLHAAIREHGVGAFRMRVLHRGGLRAMAKLEAACVERLGTTHPNGYNLTTGGAEGVRYVEESRRRMSKSAETRASKEDRTTQLAEASRKRWRRLQTKEARRVSLPTTAARKDAARRRRDVVLTADDVSVIRADYTRGAVSQRTLAERYDVSQGTISNVVLFKHW